jgi:hypothetical protein
MSTENQQSKTERPAAVDLHPLVRQLRDEADLCRNETATDIANLLDAAAKELEGMVLLQCGRKQDQEELRRCVAVLDDIASDSPWLERQAMMQRARRVLLDIGAWRKATPGEKGSFIV